MRSKKIEIKWAILFVIAQLLWMIIERAVGLHDQYIAQHQNYTLLFSIIAILVYVFALVDKRKNYYGNRMSYRQGFVSGIIITVLVTMMSPLTQWIISSIITPDYFSNIIDYSLSEGYYKSIEKAKAEFNLSNYIVMSTIGAFIMGILTSSIVAIFTKRK